MTTALERGEGSASRPGRSLPREKPGNHCTGGCVGPRAGLDRCGKSRPPPGFDPRTVQSVASRYTDSATRTTRFTRYLHYLEQGPVGSLWVKNIRIQSNNQILFPIHRTSRADHLTHTIQNDGNHIISFTSRKTDLCPGAGLLPKGVLTIQGCIQSSHIDQTNPCTNTKTPILSKFSPCSPPSLTACHSS